LYIAHLNADRVITHDGRSRQTIAQGRNAGAAVAHGEFLVFLDADAWVEDPDSFFADALDCFEVDQDLVALTATVKVNPLTATFTDRLVFGAVNVGIRIKNDVLSMGDSTGEFQMIRTSAFRLLRGYREDLVTREDADMFARLSRIGSTTASGRLTVWHSGRRAHQIGWIRLLCLWTINTVWVTLFDRAFSSEWTVVR
jgi:glycosyltransferase involved in cell wall biosynthesis